MALPSALDLIRQKESSGRNVYQQLVPRSVSSASGYYQMIKPTWQRWAKAAGIDISKYPEAIDAPEELQRKVAEYGFRTEGFKPWTATKSLVGREKEFDGGAGSAYPTKPNDAGGIPGGVVPSDLPAGGLPPASIIAAPPGVELPGVDAATYAGVNPRLLQIVRQAMQDNPGVFGIGAKGGRRDLETQKELVAKGFSKTLNSYHVHGNALDLWPVNPKTGKPDPNYLAGYPAIKAAMQAAAAKLGVTNLQTGQDWKGAWDKPHWELKGEQPYAAAGSSGAAYPSRQPDAGYTPSELPAGGIPAAPAGVLGPPGTPAPLGPTSAPAASPAAPVAPYSAAPNSDLARFMSDPARYGVSPADLQQLRRQMEAGGPGGGTLGNIPVPVPAPVQPPTTPAPPPGVLSPATPPRFNGNDATGIYPPRPPPTPEELRGVTAQAGEQGTAAALYEDWRNKRPPSLLQGGWT